MPLRPVTTAATFSPALDDERTVNPYLRFNDPEIISLIASQGLPTDTEYQRWEGIMAIE